MIVKKTPQRMCVGCQQMKDKSELARVVRNEKNEITVDLTGKMNGRGAYLCRNIECVEKARKSRKLSKAFSAQVRDDVYTALADRIKTEYGKKD